MVGLFWILPQHLSSCLSGIRRSFSTSSAIATQKEPHRKNPVNRCPPLLSLFPPHYYSSPPSSHISYPILFSFVLIPRLEVKTILIRTSGISQQNNHFGELPTHDSGLMMMKGVQDRYPLPQDPPPHTLFLCLFSLIFSLIQNIFCHPISRSALSLASQTPHTFS